MSLSPYVPIAGMFILAIVFAVFSVAAAPLLGPRRYNRAKLEAYECGIEPSPQPVSGGRFPVKFYLTAMLFIIFDVEIIFLYPWAVSFDALGTFGFPAGWLRWAAWGSVICAELALGAGVAAGSEQAAYLAAALMALFGLLLIGLIVSAHPSTPLGRGRGVVVGMLGCFVVGLLWICTYYVFSNDLSSIPVFDDLGQKNLVVGIAFMAVGFTFATRWE